MAMFSLKKVDDLRARERDREEKGTTNSAPKQRLTDLLIQIALEHDSKKSWTMHLFLTKV